MGGFAMLGHLVSNGATPIDRPRPPRHWFRRMIGLLFGMLRPYS
jgi:hypothetical protein